MSESDQTRVSLPVCRIGAALALAAFAIWPPAAGHAQYQVSPGLPSGGSNVSAAGPLFLNGGGSSLSDPYLLRTMALGVPSAVVSAMNLRGGRGGGLWLGLAGIGMGVGHGALFVAGFREEEAPSKTAVWWNAIASTYSTVSGILQIRSTIGDGSDRSTVRASITPDIDGVRLRVTWKR